MEASRTDVGKGGRGKRYEGRCRHKELHSRYYEIYTSTRQDAIYVTTMGMEKATVMGDRESDGDR